MAAFERPADLSGLALDDIARLVGKNRVPPVENWHPPHCGDSLMRIARDGTWYHDGAPIRRPAMVRLFSSILRREPDGGYVLVTPAERLDIVVEDVPFVAMELRHGDNGRNGRLAFRLNTGDFVIASTQHPLSFGEGPRGPHPLLGVRPGLDALIARPVYYELVALALAADPPGLWSDGAFFAMGGAT